MRVVRTDDHDLAAQVIKMLRENDCYCPCKIEHLPENKCMCEDFRLNTPAGNYCHCGLYKKLED
jgi:hypothetical protein